MTRTTIEAETTLDTLTGRRAGTSAAAGLRETVTRLGVHLPELRGDLPTGRTAMVTLGRAPATTALRLAAILTHAADVFPDLHSAPTASAAHAEAEEKDWNAAIELRTALHRAGLRLPSLSAAPPAAMGTAMVTLGGAASGVVLSLTEILTRAADTFPALRADAVEPIAAAREFWPLPAVLLREGHCVRYEGVTHVIGQAPRLPAPRASTAPRLIVRCVDGTTFRTPPGATLDTYLPVTWQLNPQDSLGS
ncbi:hypothetical protein [Streptomyces sp. NRRL F-5630]|uniref:hypothetical protein n=1 Tax=Streptomyces sp. NRRL F-5630 TaxID=1463864 RepID=UPI003D71D1B0